MVMAFFALDGWRGLIVFVFFSLGVVNGIDGSSANVVFDNEKIAFSLGPAS